MKNTLILLFAFLLLGGAAFWFVNKEDTTMTTLNIDDRKFAVENTDDVGKIFIANRQGKTNTFVRKGDDEWELNGKYKARPYAIKTLLSTIGRLELSYIPAKAAIPHIVEILGSHGIKVEIYDREGNNMKTYYVGGLDKDEEGTFMIMEGSEQPYVMKLPAFNGGVRVRYSQKEIDLRDRYIFDYDLEDISYVSVEYPKQKNKSFILEKKDGEYEVTPFNEITPTINRPVKQGFVESYLVGFNRFEAENIINNYKHRDSISQMMPFAIMTVKSKTGESQIGRFHPLRKIGDDGLPVSDEEVLMNTAVERYHIDHSNGDDYVVQQRNFGRAFWSYESFFEEKK
ncbi:MAG: DUF4340 domain-containing protein [Saprospiraceae bacterium]